jgi:hypothetical protein
MMVTVRPAWREALSRVDSILAAFFSRRDASRALRHQDARAARGSGFRRGQGLLGCEVYNQDV